MVGIPGMRAFFFHSRWQTLGVPSVLTRIGQLHQSPPLFVPGDLFPLFFGTDIRIYW